MGDTSSFANSFTSTQGSGGEIGKAFCLGENFFCSAGALSCKALLLRPRELLEVPMAAPLLSVLRAWWCSPGMENMVMLCHACRSSTGGFPGLNPPPRKSDSKPPSWSTSDNIYKGKKIYCKERVWHLFVLLLFCLVMSFQLRKPPLAKFRWPSCEWWINIYFLSMTTHTYPDKQTFLWKVSLFGWSFEPFWLKFCHIWS